MQNQYAFRSDNFCNVSTQTSLSGSEIEIQTVQEAILTIAKDRFSVLNSRKVELMKLIGMNQALQVPMPADYEAIKSANAKLKREIHELGKKSLELKQAKTKYFDLTEERDKLLKVLRQKPVFQVELPQDLLGFLIAIDELANQTAALYQQCDHIVKKSQEAQEGNKLQTKIKLTQQEQINPDSSLYFPESDFMELGCLLFKIVQDDYLLEELIASDYILHSSVIQGIFKIRTLRPNELLRKKVVLAIIIHILHPSSHQSLIAAALVESTQYVMSSIQALFRSHLLVMRHSDDFPYYYQMISFERTLEELRSIKMVCRGIGCSDSTLNLMINVLKLIPTELRLNNYHQEYLQKNTLGAFPKKDFESVRVEYYKEIIDWQELYLAAKPLMTFAVIDCNENYVPEEITKFRKTLLDEKLVKFLVFNCNLEILQLGDPAYILIPPLEESKLVYYLEDQVQQFVCQVIEYLSFEMVKLKNDTSQLVLFNMREEKLNDISKLKKRKLGRQQKILGDICLMVDDPQDAIEYYKVAQSQLKDDHLWLAQLHQSWAAIRQSIPEIEEHFREAIVCLRKTKFLTLEIECFFKQMRFRVQEGNLEQLDKTVNLFLKSFDPESPLDKCKFYIFAASLYQKLSKWRKQAYYLKLASNIVTKINKPLALSLMQQALQLYKLGSFAGQGETKVFWISMQHALLNELQSLEMDANKGIDIIQTFRQQYTVKQLNSLLANATQDMVFTQSNLSQMPCLVDVKVEQWTGLFRTVETTKVADSVFIVNPWNKQVKELRYPQDELITVIVSFDNSLPLGIQIALELKCDGIQYLSYPTLLKMEPNSKVSIKLYLRALSSGTLNITGLIAKLQNHIYTHKLNIDLVIIEPLPNVGVQVHRESTMQNEVPVVLFDPSEIFTYQIQITNTGRSVSQCQFELCIEAEDPPIYQYNSEIPDFYLEEYQKKTIRFAEITELGSIQVPKIGHQIKDIKKISLYLLFKYEDGTLRREIRIARLVRMKPLLSIASCLFVSKYKSNQKEIFDLQDTCYLSIQLEKTDFLVEVNLKSPLLVEAESTQIMTEKTLPLVLKLRKAPLEQLQNPDLHISWKNLLDGRIGQLSPFENVKSEDIAKHCANDLILLQCSEENKVLKYTITIHPKLTQSEFVFVALSLTQHSDNQSQKSMVSSVKQINAEIIGGHVGFRLQIQGLTIKEGILQLSSSAAQLKVQVIDNQTIYIKRGIIQ